MNTPFNFIQVTQNTIDTLDTASLQGIYGNNHRWFVAQLEANMDYKLPVEYHAQQNAISAEVTSR